MRNFTPHDDREKVKEILENGEFVPAKTRAAITPAQSLGLMRESPELSQKGLGALTLVPERLKSSIGRIFDQKVNCFCVSEFFYRDTQFRNSSADEMLDFVAKNFQQVHEDSPNILMLIWSRSSLEVPIGQIQVHELAKRSPGFPFGLILEHSFVKLNENTAFQKADPKLTSKIELASVIEAIEPCSSLNGFEITRHIPISQF